MPPGQLRPGVENRFKLIDRWNPLQLARPQVDVDIDSIYYSSFFELMNEYRAFVSIGYLSCFTNNPSKLRKHSDWGCLVSPWSYTEYWNRNYLIHQ